MRLVTFRAGNRDRLGAEVGGHVVDLTAAHAAAQRSAGPPRGDVGHFPESLLSLLRAGPAALEAARVAVAFAAGPGNLAALAREGQAFTPEAVEYRPPVPHPAKIVCLGQNYRQHAAEMGGEVPEYPVLFSKYDNALIGHRQPIELPAVSRMVDYEAELAIVIGTRARALPADRALSCVAGYTVLNDVSVRDYQRRTTQWLQGKTFDRTCPVGPALVTADEVRDAQALDIRLRLNGQVMQDSNTSDFIFRIERILEYLTQIVTLEPGDLIATGTPSGVGAARKPPVFLRPGDVVEVEIAGLGVLRNPVVDAPA